MMSVITRCMVASVSREWQKEYALSPNNVGKKRAIF